MADGYVYVLANEGMPGALKIGSTTRNPFTRAKELQTTGVPHPFVVAAAVRVSNASAVEKAVHRELARRDLRINGDREFFSADLAEVLGVMATLCAEGNEMGGGAVEARTGMDALLDAIAFRDGVGNQPPDMKKALLAFEEAAALGSRHADYVLMQLYSGGREVRKSASKMLFYRKKVDVHIRELSSNYEGILELAAMYCGPSFYAYQGREAAEQAAITMFRNKQDEIGLSIISMVVARFGFEHSVLEAINEGSHLIGSPIKTELQSLIVKWISLDQICEYLINNINSVIDNQLFHRSVNMSNYVVFSRNALIFREFDVRSMYGWHFATIATNLRILSYRDIEKRPRITGRGINDLGEWVLGEKNAAYL